jgi:hypothetical protein
MCLALRLPAREAAERLAQSLSYPGAPGLDRNTRAAFKEAGFVTGRVLFDRQPIAFRLIGYRPKQWFGRATPIFDPDKMAKPALRGTISGNGTTCQVEYKIDSFATALSAVILTALGIIMFVVGAVLLGVDRGPMPSLGFVFLVSGGVCLIFVFLILQVLDNAILDEAFLRSWLSTQLTPFA